MRINNNINILWVQPAENGRTRHKTVLSTKYLVESFHRPDAAVHPVHRRYVLFSNTHRRRPPPRFRTSYSTPTSTQLPGITTVCYRDYRTPAGKGRDTGKWHGQCAAIVRGEEKSISLRDRGKTRFKTDFSFCFENIWVKNKTFVFYLDRCCVAATTTVRFRRLLASKWPSPNRRKTKTVHRPDSDLRVLPFSRRRPTTATDRTRSRCLHPKPRDSRVESLWFTVSPGRWDFDGFRRANDTTQTVASRIYNSFFFYFLIIISTTRHDHHRRRFYFTRKHPKEPAKADHGVFDYSFVLFNITYSTQKYFGGYTMRCTKCNFFFFY